MRTPTLTSTMVATLLGVAASHATIVPYAEYHLGEAGSLGGSNKPQDSSGNGRHIGADISGGDATTGNASFHPNATGSTAYLDTSMGGNQGWYSGGTFSSLQTDNFAFGVFARAASIGEPNGDVFTVGDSTGSLKLSLEGNGWAGSCHNVAWIGPGGGASGSFTPNTWVHLAMIRAGGITTFYIDGVAQAGTFGGTPVNNNPHVSVQPGGGAYFDGNLDEARVVTFSPGESTAKILSALQQGVTPTSLVNVGFNAFFNTANLSTDEDSYFRLGGAVEDLANITTSLSVVAGTAPKHRIHITQEGEIPVGTYPLIDYSGTIGGLGFAGLELAPLPGRITGTLVNNTDDSTIDLVITGSEPGNITWKGTGGTWEVEGATNFVFSGTSTPTAFYAGDYVLMDDTATTSTITVAATVTPSTLSINNSTRDYSFSGAAIGGSASIEKFGTGALTFTNPNTHSGENYFDAGTVRVGNGGGSGSLGSGPVNNNATLIINRTGTLEMLNAISGSGSIQKLGSGTLTLGGNSSFTGALTLTEGIIASANENSLGDIAGSTTVAAGATLDIFTGGFGDEPIFIQGAGVDGNGAVVNSAIAGKLDGMQHLTLLGDTTVGGPGRWDIRGNGSTLDGNFKFTKIANNQISLVLTTVSVKDIEVNSGLLSLEYGTVVNNTNPGTITVNSGATLGFGSFGNPITCSKPIVLNGGGMNTTWNDDQGSATIASTVGLAAVDNSINVQGSATITLAGAVSGSGSLHKTGPGTLALTTASSYAGNTTVWDGTLSLAASGLADAATVFLSSTATLQLGFAGTDTVDKLFINGVQQAAGVYGSSHPSGRFAGTGTLTVTSGPTATFYQTWETENGISGAGGTADSDNDGIPNGIEFVIGGDPSGPGSDSSGLLPTGTKDGTHLVIVFRRTDASIADSPAVQYGSVLSGWTAAQNGVNGVVIEEANDFFGSGIDRVTVRLPLGLAANGKLFARLAVGIP